MKTILVGLDGSPRSDGVLAYAETLARIAGAKLFLVRCFSIPSDMAQAWPCSDEVLESALRVQAQKYLDDCAGRVPTELLAAVRAVLGDPWRAVCKTAIDENVDLIVIGSHGYGGIDHLIGTTAAKVVNHADRPVLVFR